jgi:beta-glucanase (GH16 family)
MKTYLSLFFCVLILAGCGSDDKEDEVEEGLPPSNLEVIVEVEEGNTGKVTVTATADNASSYKVSFGYFTPNTAVDATNGVATFTYPFSGTYDIKVIAYGNNTSETVEETEVVEVIRVYTGATSPESYDGMTLVWQDEFSAESLNTSDWTFEIGTGSNGWGNNELQYYRAENTSLVDGNLVITAKNDGFSGRSYTSSRIITKDKQTFLYGRIDIRAVLPYGQGIWPALWMLGNNISDPNVGWPKCGEIDIMELVGGGAKDKTVHGTAHWQDVAGYANYGGHVNLSTGIFADNYHVFSIVWDADFIIWYMDNVEFHRIDISPTDNPSRLDEFRAEQFLIFNVAVGGNWPGAPDGTTKFPQRMLVDYVRYFQAE